MKRLSSITLAALLVGCAGDAGHHHYDGHNDHHDPHGHDAHGNHHDHAHPPGPFSYAPQALGHGTDGLVLRSVRHAAHHGFHRLVFDVSRPHGEAQVIPRAAASYHQHDLSIDLRIEGVTRDVTGHELHKAVPVDRPPVAHFERHGHQSHHSVAYRVQLTRGARYRLHAVDAPVRIVLDVERIDLEH